MARNECLPWIAVCLLASQSAAPAESLQAAIRACAAQADDSARLQCYDRVAQFKSVAANDGRSSHSPNIPPTDPAVSPSTALAARTSTPLELNTADQFGLTSGQILRKESAGNPPPPVRRLTAHVVALSTRRSGRLVLRLENGQVWEQTEDGPDLNIVSGSEVTIDRGLLGAYYLSAQSKHAAIKVSRIE
jgi:hypothetical protein